MAEQADGPNIYTTDWDRTLDRGRYRMRGTRLGGPAGARALGLGVFELDPGHRNLPYHAHHGIEELIVVLEGAPTLRTPAGERRLARGEVVACPAGRGGAHQLINQTDATVRFLIASTKSPVDLIEYPDSGKVSAQAGEWGTPDAVAYMLAGEPQLDYFAGEPE
jgi:uncharacterized cupin superfamily protein